MPIVEKQIIDKNRQNGMDTGFRSGLHEGM